MLEKMLALQNKRKKEGGFTLVELIVVLVILAILAALLIPALTGYIDKAKDRKIIAECRQAVMAAQTLADEEYGKTSGEVKFGAADATGVAYHYSDVEDLAEVPAGTVKNVKTNTEGKVTNLTYTNGKTITYTDGSYSDPSK